MPLSTSPVCSWMQIPTTFKITNVGMSSVLHPLQQDIQYRNQHRREYYSRVNFTKSMAYTGAPISSSHQSRRQQALCCWFRWQRAPLTIEAGGNLTNLETFSSSQLTGRAIIGLAFDPNNANNLWISHNNPLFPQPPKISQAKSRN